MNSLGQHDVFVIINGPEDGAVFAVVRAPFYIGNAPSCTVNIRLDADVQRHHALVTTVSDGYRIRRLDAWPVFVDGKKVGRFRSRIIRSESFVQVGHTLMNVQCAQDGLAKRSHGIASETDAGWAIRYIWGKAWSASIGLVRQAVAMSARLLFSWKSILALSFLSYVFWPPVRFQVNRFFTGLYLSVLHRLFGR